MTNMIKSVSDPPIWKPTLPPSMRTVPGADHPACVPAGQNALAIFPAEYESRRLEPRHDHDAMGIFEQFIRDAFVRRVHDFRKYSSCFV